MSTSAEPVLDEADRPLGRRRKKSGLSTRMRSAHERLTEPRDDGLPNARVVAWFPLLVTFAIAVLTALSWNGSSTGAWRQMFIASADPDLLAGQPRPIRTDEWFVESSWVVSQVSEGFPHINRVFPGGTDATLFNDLPTWDWSTAFRPHTWGFLAFGLDHGMAVRWWLPAALMVVAAYFFVVTILPRRPGLGAVLALATVFQPLVQWWWLPVVPNPVAFAFMAMAAAVWGYRCTGRWGRWVTAALAGYLAVDMAMGIYVPDMIPCILALAAFVVGFVLRKWRGEQLGLRALVAGIAPLVVASVGALIVVGVWVFTRRQAVEAVLSTVYPGNRVTPPGTEGKADLVSVLSGPFQRALQIDPFNTMLGDNQSEASTPILLSLFLLVPLAWMSVTLWRRERKIDWVVVAIVVVQALVLAYYYLPGWGALSDTIGLGRTLPARSRLIFVVLAVVAVVLLAERQDQLKLRVPVVPSLLAGLVVLLAGAWTWHELRQVGSTAVPSASSVIVLVLLTTAVVAFSLRRPAFGAVLFLAGSLIVGLGVNPLYRGVFDLRNETKAGRTVERLHHHRPAARWVGVGTFLTMSTLVETGVPAYSGVQTYPSEPMWTQIDPDHQYETAWNRLAHVNWIAGSGAPAPRQPPEGYQDQINLTFDSCAAFAQRYVTYVLADTAPIDQPCVRLIRAMKQDNNVQWIYRVTKSKSTSTDSVASFN